MSIQFKGNSLIGSGLIQNEPLDHFSYLNTLIEQQAVMISQSIYTQTNESNNILLLLEDE